MTRILYIQNFREKYLFTNFANIINGNIHFVTQLIIIYEASVKRECIPVILQRTACLVAIPCSVILSSFYACRQEVLSTL